MIESQQYYIRCGNPKCNAKIDTIDQKTMDLMSRATSGMYWCPKCKVYKKLNEIVIKPKWVKRRKQF